MNIPKHIAIMMDGNGRWGRQRGLTRSQGHYAGSQAMEAIIKDSIDIGIKALTLYAFSSENWSRPKDEVNYLMELPAVFLREKLPDFMKNNIRVMISGDIQGLPAHTKEAVEIAVNETRNNDRLIVNFALNYGGRNELLFALKSLVDEVQQAKMSIEEISASTIETFLYTKGIPDPEIIIRTGGEKRISNFLLWQASNSELWYTDTYFPDFNKELLLQAIAEVYERKHCQLKKVD